MLVGFRGQEVVKTNNGVQNKLDVFERRVVISHGYQAS
jgi:hypothetical protein